MTQTLQMHPQHNAAVSASAGLPVATSGNGRRLRVMHVVNDLGRGGTEFGVLKVMGGLSSGFFEHRLCTTRRFDPDFVKTYELKDILHVAGSSREGLQFPLFRLWKIFRQYRPHIVHTRNWGGLEAVPAARLAGVPVVIHSEHGYEVSSLLGIPRRQRVFRWMAYAMADKVFAVTRELREYHARQAWVRPDSIEVIPNGVDTQRFRPCTVARGDIRRRLGLAEDRLVIGSVGRMVPIKDYTTLLMAAQQLIGRGINLHVLLVGNGPELESLDRRVRESEGLRNRVSFLGASEQVPELLNAMDIFVLPSLGEGMSNTLLEAMACGLPLVATRVGGNPEVVEDGRSGWLFAPGDIPALADCIERLATSAETRRALGGAARQRALTVFSLDRMIDSYCSLYVDAATQRGLLVRG